MGHQKSAPVGGVLGVLQVWGEEVISDQRLPLAISAGLFFLVVLVMRGLLGGIFGRHIDEVWMSLKDLHRISSEFETFKFSSSYVSGAERTSGLQGGT